MKYEIDFIGTKENKGNADAICFRYKKNGKFINVVYDGGSKGLVSELTEHLKKYYFENKSNPKIIDYLICSHPDQDHASGIIEIINNFQIGKIIMNIPWNYINDIWEYIDDRRITEDSLIKRLKKNYPYVNEIETLANQKNIEILEGFENTIINENLKILSPSKDFFLELLIESNKTPLEKSKPQSSFLESVINKIKETWDKDSLKEDIKTSVENEMSIILLGDMEEEHKFLLTGDAGIRGLNKAIEKANKIFIPLKKVNFYQIPHHGSRHNLSPSIMNKIVGKIKKKSTESNKVAYVSVAYNSNYPKTAVVNAFIRRGVKVYKTEGKTICYSHSMPTRKGWNPLEELLFCQESDELE
jgi:hypothetical protein